MMSVIETQIWEEIPEKKGYVRYVGQRKLVEVFNELEAYLKKEGICPEEYFLPTHEAQPDITELSVPCFPCQRTAGRGQDLQHGSDGRHRL